jgi:hypothetical protein
VILKDQTINNDYTTTPCSMLINDFVLQPV